MKIINLVKLCLMVVASTLMSCNGPNESSAPAHLEAVSWNQSIEDIYEELAEKVQDFEEENKEFSSSVTNSNTPDPAVVRKVKRHETLIADYKSILRKHELIIEQNKAYLSKHESSAMSALEIQAQHEQIYKNLLIIQEDATQISETIDVVLTMYVALERTLDT